jgi:hypothetical protein
MNSNSSSTESKSSLAVCPFWAKMGTCRLFHLASGDGPHHPYSHPPHPPHTILLLRNAYMGSPGNLNVNVQLNTTNNNNNNEYRDHLAYNKWYDMILNYFRQPHIFIDGGAISLCTVISASDFHNGATYIRFASIGDASRALTHIHTLAMAAMVAPTPRKYNPKPLHVNGRRRFHDTSIDSLLEMDTNTHIRQLIHQLWRYGHGIINARYCPDISDVQCLGQREGTCRRGGFCAFPHLRPIPMLPPLLSLSSSSSSRRRPLDNTDADADDDATSSKLRRISSTSMTPSLTPNSDDAKATDELGRGHSKLAILD